MSKNNSSYGKLNILKLISEGRGCVSFVGAGGVSMSSLMRLSGSFGIRCVGFDKKDGEYVSAMRKLGEKIETGVGHQLPSDTVLVVYSLAIDEDDPIMTQAHSLNIPCISRAEYMSALTLPYGKKIGVSGSHGKSSTVAMFHAIFSEWGVNPTTLSGAHLSGTKSSYHIGALDYLIYEGCEYKDSFLAFEPDISLFLNFDYDHIDYFKSEEQLMDSFLLAIKKAAVPIINADDGKLRKIAKKCDTPPVLVGQEKECKYRYKIISDTPRALKFCMYRSGDALGDITLSLVGGFNISNAAMAVSASIECGVPFSVCQAALSKFEGIASRLERIGSYNGRPVYMDYAHHPTEIKCGIKALKSDTGGKLTVIFGPHTYSRTYALFGDFVNALSMADCLLLTEIDPVREKRTCAVSSDMLAAATHGRVIRSSEELSSLLEATCGAIVIMGAADMTEIKNVILKND